MVDNKHIHTLLAEIGLDEREALIYRTLLIKGNMSLLHLSQEIHLPRTTIYRLCENLVHKNILEWVLKYKSRDVKAIAPAGLKNYIHTQEKHIRAIKNAVNELIACSHQLELNPLETEVRYYTGIEGMKQLIWNTLKADQVILGYTPWGRDRLTGVDFEQNYSTEARKRNIQDMVILNKQGLQRFLSYFSQPLDSIQRARVLDLYISSDIYIYNNVYAINTWVKGEIRGVEIENSEICKLQRGIFKQLWKGATPLDKYIQNQTSPYRFVYSSDRKIR